MARGLGIAAWNQRYDREQDPNYRRMTEEEAAAKNDRRVGDRMDGSDYERRNTDYKHSAGRYTRREKSDYGYENRQTLHSIDRDIHTLPEPSGPGDEMDYWDKSTTATDAKFEEWRKRLRKRGYSDEEIEDILSDAVSLHD